MQIQNSIWTRMAVLCEAMAVVLKHPVGSSPGLVVFTHKERTLLDPNLPVIGTYLAQAKTNYVFAMHWGWLHQNQPSYKAVDAHIGVADTVTFENESEIYRIPFNSSMFTPSAFDFRRETPKQWDILSVTRTLRAKRTPDLLRSLRALYDIRPNTRTLLVVTAPSEFSAQHDQNVPELYHELFSQEEQERISFIYVRGDRMRPITRDDMAFLFSAARVFCLFSEKEGESRVLKEAMCAGLPVLADENLLGGGLQFFTENNSRTFASPDEAAGKMRELLDEFEMPQSEKLRLFEALSEEHSVPRFERALRGLFDSLGHSVEGEFLLHDLAIRLPSHDYRELPPEMRSGKTADLTTGEAMARFLKHLATKTPLPDCSLTEDEARFVSEFGAKTKKPSKPRKRKRRRGDDATSKSAAPKRNFLVRTLSRIARVLGQRT